LVSVGSLNALNISLVAATLQMRALTVAAGVARAALALVGGPVGLVVLGLTAAVIAARRYRASLAAMGTESEEAAAALTELRKIAAEGWQTDRLDEVREHINTLREQADEAADALEKLVKKAHQLPGNVSGRTRGIGGVEGVPTE